MFRPLLQLHIFFRTRLHRVVLNQAQRHLQAIVDIVTFAQAYGIPGKVIQCRAMLIELCNSWLFQITCLNQSDKTQT